MLIESDEAAVLRFLKKTENEPKVLLRLLNVFKAYEELIGLIVKNGQMFLYDGHIQSHREICPEVFERMILTHGHEENALWYARNCINGRWPACEPKILESGINSYLEEYARFVLSGNWDEEVAKKCTCWMYYYAKDVIKGKLPEELHNRMTMACVMNKDDPWCKKYFGPKKYKRVRKPR